MTTPPPTPAGWFPDPEQAGTLRYWDGAAWTEHRSPAPEAAAPAAPEPAAEPPAEYSAPADPGHVGSHRAPESAPESPSVTDQPTADVPRREWTPEPPPELRDWASSTPEPESEPASYPEPTTDPTREQTPESSYPPPLPLTDQPTTKVPLRDWTPEGQQEPPAETVPYADATTSTPPEPPPVEPPAGTEPRVPVDNRKLVLGFAGAVAALLLVLVLAAVYAFIIHEPDTVDASSPTTETTTVTTQKAPTSDDSTASESAPPPPLAGAVDGPLTFSVAGVESGTTITDSENEFLTKDAQGEFIVVRLTVQNTSPDPGQFLGTFQKLNAGGQVYTIDDEATFYVGGGFVDIPPGGQVDVGLAYDVPPGTVPESVELHADPMTPGVVLPVS
jgi:Domain of unknown function (DUF4352)/Protein of unknown function (DUF2510)